MNQNPSPTRRRPRLPARLVAVAWRDLLVIVVPILVLTAMLAWLAVAFLRPAPPSRIVLSAGPEGSSYLRTAERYREIIERHGVEVEILASRGSLENLQRLADPAFVVDVGFVQGGLVDDTDVSGLMSLGSMFAQPLVVYYRGAEPVDRLSQFRGRRLAIGPEGSGTRALVLKLLAANDIDADSARLFEFAGDEAAQALIEGRVDAAFLTGDSATPRVMRRLRQTPGVELMHFRQANGYVRRFRFLSRLTLPEGSLDLAGNFPPRNYHLVGPTVELVARNDLHPALSDLLISAAREVHGRPGLFRDSGEYPAPLARDFALSADAERYYQSGTQFLYARLPFWMASLVDRLLVILVPLLVLIVPATRVVPPLYRWRVRSRLYPMYGQLMAIERDIMAGPDAEKQQAIHRRLDEIEEKVNNVRMPLSFADQIYVMREHISLVRHRLSEPHA